MAVSRAELVLHSILKAAPLYMPCLTCQHGWFNGGDHLGWCKNVPPSSSPRPIDEVNTCAAWRAKIEEDSLE
jgi:hypothetical protein